RPPSRSTLLPYTTLFRSAPSRRGRQDHPKVASRRAPLQEAAGQALGELRQVHGAGAGKLEYLVESRSPLSMHQYFTEVFRRLPQDRKSTRLNSSHLGISY